MQGKLEEFYKIAKEHKNSHRGCGGEPYLDCEYLFDFVQDVSVSHVANEGEFNILELGMGIGFTSLVMHLANKNAEIDAIETHGEHLQLAKNWFKEIQIQEKLQNNISNILSKINIIQADVHNILPYLETDKYDFIFFDVYGPKEKFLLDFERILKVGGILYSVNSHLKSAEQKYFEYLNNSPKWEKLYQFNDTKIYQKIF